MQGKNEIHFNQATMIDIINHYFRTVLFKTYNMKVISVEYSNNDHVFKIKIDIQDEELSQP